MERFTGITAMLRCRLGLLAVLGLRRGLGAAVVVDDLGVGDGAGVLDDGAADGVDPLLLLLLGVGDEVHGLGGGGELEGELAVEHVLGALDGEAGGDGDDAAGHGGPRHGGVLEPEEAPLLEHEPTAPPRLDVLALLVEPPRALGPVPELDPAGRRVGRRRGGGGGPADAVHHGPPQAGRHRRRGEFGDRVRGRSRRGAGGDSKKEGGPWGWGALGAGFRRGSFFYFLINSAGEGKGSVM